MGTQSKTEKRQVNFKDAMKLLSDSMDEKFLQTSQHFTQLLSSFKLRLEVLEDLLMEKLGETEDSLKERLLLRVEKLQGFEEVDTEVKVGSIIRIKVKEEIVGQESPATPMQDSFMCVGHNQINSNIDVLVKGAKAGETREVTIPNPNQPEELRKLTVLVVRVFKGNEKPESVVTPENPVETPMEPVTNAQS